MEEDADRRAGSGVPLLCARASRIPLHPLTRLRSGAERPRKKKK